MDIKRHLPAFFPESPSYLGLNELTMKFTEEREEAYLREGLETFLSKKRLGFVLGIAMFSIFALVDFVLAPQNMGPLLFVRFGITSAILFFVLALSYIDKVKPRFYKIVFASVLIMNLSHLIVFTKLPPDLLPRYHFSYLILIVYSSFMMATTFLNTALAVVLSVLFYIGYLSFNPALAAGDKLLFSVVALVLAVIVILAVYYAEYLSRRSYVLEIRLVNREEFSGPESKEDDGESGIKAEKELKKHGDSLLKDQSADYGDFKQGLLKDYELRLNQLQKDFERSEARCKELEAFNRNLMSDMDKTMTENKELKDIEKIKIEEKSFDDIKLMGRMGSFASSSMIKNISDNLDYFDENQDEFRSSSSLRYINNTNYRLRENLYIAGAMKYRFDLFRVYLEHNALSESKTEVAASVQRAFSKLSRFFEGTGHLVDVTCKDGVFVRMREESMDLILQNLVMTSLVSAARQGESAHIVISVRDEKSKVIIEYQDEGRNYAGYYKEILKLKDIHSDIVSVSGLEIFFIRDLIQRETGGEIQIESKGNNNKLIMSFIK